MNECPTRLISGTPPAALDRLRHRPGGAHVVDHLPARLVREHPLGEQRRDEVARARTRPCRRRRSSGRRRRRRRPRRPRPPRRVRRDDELAVLGQERVRLVVRERPVRLEVAANDLDLRQPLEHPRQHLAGHPVRGVDDDPQRARSRRASTKPSTRVDERRPRRPPARPRRAPPRATRRAPRGRGRRAAPTRSRPAARPRRTIFIPCTPPGCATR